MDLFDLKIIEELFANSREPLSKIGKSVRLSRENVHYRIQRLINRGIIKEFITEIDYAALGFSHFVVFLQYTKITKQKEKEIISFLEKQGSISWIGLLTGKWSMTFDIYSTNVKKLNKIINALLNEFKENIGEYSVLETLDSEYYFSKVINSQFVYKPKKSILNKNKFDATDLRILEQLNTNPRIKYTELSLNLNLTPNGIKQRINSLKKKGIILTYGVSINHKSFDYEWHGFQIRLLDYSKELERKLKEFLRYSKETIFFYQYGKNGMYDFDVGVIVKSSSDLRDFINKIRTEFYNEIHIFDTFLVLEEVSSHKLPDIIFKS